MSTLVLWYGPRRQLCSICTRAPLLLAVLLPFPKSHTQLWVLKARSKTCTNQLLGRPGGSTTETIPPRDSGGRTLPVYHAHQALRFSQSTVWHSGNELKRSEEH